MRALEKQNPIWPSHFDHLRSDDPDRSSELVSTTLSKVRYRPLSSSSFSHALKIVRIGEFNVWRTFSASGFELQAEDTRNNRFEIHFVESGHYHSLTNNQNVKAHSGQAYILHRFNRHDILCQPETGQICISIPEARYAKLIAAEFDEPDMPLAAFQQVVEVDQPVMHNLKRLVDLLMLRGCSEEAPWQSSIGAHLLKEAFLALFIEVWPREGEPQRAQVAKPFYVKRALEWLHQHAAEKIMLEDVAAASGVSIRTLQLGFRKYLGLSPMAYLLKVRLQHAHNDLLNDPSATIEEISTRWGFASPSKFAAQVRWQFGHNPSELRKLLHYQRRHHD